MGLVYSELIVHSFEPPLVVQAFEYQFFQVAPIGPEARAIVYFIGDGQREDVLSSSLSTRLRAIFCSRTVFTCTRKGFFFMNLGTKRVG